MGYIEFPSKDNYLIPQFTDWSIQDEGRWMSFYEYDYLVEMIMGKSYMGQMNIENYITNEFNYPFCLFFTTYLDKSEIGSNWKHLIAVEGFLKEEGLYLKDFYRVGFLRNDLPINNALDTIKKELKKYDSKYYYTLKDNQHIQVGWLGHTGNSYKGLLNRLDDWWKVFGGRLYGY